MVRSNAKQLHFLLFICALCSFISSAGTLTIDTEKERYDLTSYIEVNFESDNTIDTPPVENWLEISQAQKNFGFSPSVHWFRFTLINTESQAIQRFLEIDSPLIDQLSIHILEDGNVISSQQLGDQQPFNQRPILANSFVIPIQFGANQTLEFYISVSSSGLIDVPFYLWSSKGYFEQQQSSILLTGLIIGLIVTVALITLIAAVISQNVFYVYTSFLLLSLTSTYFILEGLAFQVLWPNTPGIQNIALPISISCAVALMTLAERDTLVKMFASRHFTLPLNAILVLCAVSLPAVFISYYVAILISVFIAVSACIAILVIAYLSYRKGIIDHSSLNLSLMSLLIVLLCFAVGVSLDLVSTSYLTQVYLYALALQAATLLYDLYRSLSATQMNVVDSGDIQLSEKMFELQEALRELEEKNIQLERVSTLDALSGIHNRRHFDKRLLAELRRARREQRELALIIFDIDHFKNINDNYGHLAGDEVIRSVAYTANHTLQRPSDEIFRYGGEEFAVILPETSLDGAKEVAEKIRQNIEALQIVAHEKSIHCTISAGVSIYDNTQPADVNTVIAQADSKLYEAKNSGRNKIL